MTAVLGDRVRRWIGIFSAFFSTQTVTQALGFATGILFIRVLPVRELGLYNLAFSVITFFNLLSDLGSTTSLLHFFQRAAKEGTDFRLYVAAVWSLRQGAFFLGVLVVAVGFPLAAVAKGFARWDVAWATAGVLLCVWFQIQYSLRVLDLRLHDRYGQSYRADMAAAGLRLAIAASLVAAALLKAWPGVFATAAGTALGAFLARRREAAAPLPPGGLGPYRRQILRYLLPTLPSAFYFTVQGPLLVWLAATFGSVRTIAEVGAVGRLGLAVGIFSGLIGTVFLPRLARLTDDRVYLARFLQFGALLAAVALAMTAAAVLAPGFFLFLLGPHYSGLRSELVLVVAGAGLSLLDGYLVSVNLARSWTRWQGAGLVVVIAGQAALLTVLPLTSTYNVLLFNLFSGGFAFVFQGLVALAGFVRPKWVYWN